MNQGFNVVVNGSREYLPMARALYPTLQVLLIEAQPETIKARLLSRGRETLAQIEQRIARNQRLPPINNAISINNDTYLNDAGTQLTAILTA